MKFIKLFKDRFKQKGQTKYLLINTEYTMSGSYVINAYFETHEFSSKADADNFLYYKIAKSDLKNWKLYKEQL